MASPAKFPEAKSAFHTLLLTFRSDEGGQLEDTSLSDQI